MKTPLTFIFLTLALLSGCGAPGASDATPTPAPTPIIAQKPEYIVQRGEVTRTLRLTGRVSPVKQQALFFRTAGIVHEVYVSRGDTVNSGDVLARLDEPEVFQAEVTSAELDVAQARYDLDQLIQNAPLDAAEAQLELIEAEEAYREAQRVRQNKDFDRVGDELIIQKAEADYLLAKAKVKEVEKEYNRIANRRITDPERVAALNALLDARADMERKFALYNWYLLPASDSEISKADADLALAEARYEAAREEYSRLQGGPDESELRLAEARVTEAESRLAVAQKTLSNIELRAPFDGEVISLGLVPGSSVTAFRPVLVIADPSELEITAFITGEELSILGIGQRAIVQLNTHPGESFPAHIVDMPISTDSLEEQDGDQSQQVHFLLDDPNLKLRMNEAAMITVDIEARQDVLWLPSAALRTFQGMDFVFIEQDGLQRRVDIVTGLRSADRVEIIEGLQEGDVVIGQ